MRISTSNESAGHVIGQAKVIPGGQIEARYASLLIIIYWSAKSISLTGGPRECFGVVGPESQGGHMIQLTSLMQLRSGAPGRAGKISLRILAVLRQSGVFLEVPAICLEAPCNAGTKPGSTSNLCGAVPEKQHLLWDYYWCPWKLWLLLIIQWFSTLMYAVWPLNYVSKYLCINIAGHQCTVYLDCLQLVFESNLRLAWRWQTSTELTDAHWGCNWAASVMSLEAIIIWTSQVWSSAIAVAFGSHDRANLKVMINSVWWCNWRLW